MPFGILYGLLVGAAAYAVARMLDWPGLRSIERAGAIIGGGLAGGLTLAWILARDRTPNAPRDPLSTTDVEPAPEIAPQTERDEPDSPSS